MPWLHSAMGKVPPAMGAFGMGLPPAVPEAG
jgi:hypothetical protein